MKRVTTEGLIFYVLGILFSSLEYNSMIRVASLVERLESYGRILLLLFVETYLGSHEAFKKRPFESLGNGESVSFCYDS